MPFALFLDILENAPMVMIFLGGDVVLARLIKRTGLR
jgi:hypothetical protein